MKKIRINELARELEVKAHEILDRLPELGVTEKKTHSSSIDEDVAIRLRRLYGHEVPEPAPEEKPKAETPLAEEARTQEHEMAPAAPTAAAEPVAAPVSAPEERAEPAAPPAEVAPGEEPVPAAITQPPAEEKPAP